MAGSPHMSMSFFRFSTDSMFHNEWFDFSRFFITCGCGSFTGLTSHAQYIYGYCPINTKNVLHIRMDVFGIFLYNILLKVPQHPLQSTAQPALKYHPLQSTTSLSLKYPTTTRVFTINTQLLWIYPIYAISLVL